MRADLRLIAAANRDLDKCVRDGQFRSDLFFRLNVLPLRLPSLRDRRGDIATLTRHFLKALLPSSAPEKGISLAAMRMLEAYEWPGNVRELYNTIQRSLAFSQDAPILPVHLGLPHVCPEENGKGGFKKARSQVIENFEKTYLEEMLRNSGGNVTRAAVAAGKDRRVFGRLMKRYNIDRSAYQ
jgi:DNA-binding NtrC family response regulator